MNPIAERIKNHFKGDIHILLIVFFLSVMGVIVQFSAKGRLTMDGPLSPLVPLLKSLVILLAGFWCMGKISQMDYLKSTKRMDLLLYGSWILIELAYKPREFMARARHDGGV
mgnify:CR=1 FL=1